MRDEPQIWSVANAKARLSEVLDRARSEGPQTITRNGRTAAVVVSAEEWERRTKQRGSLGDFLANSPLKGSGLNLERQHATLRDVEL